MENEKGRNKGALKTKSQEKKAATKSMCEGKQTTKCPGKTKKGKKEKKTNIRRRVYGEHKENTVKELERQLDGDHGKLPICGQEKKSPKERISGLLGGEP